MKFTLSWLKKFLDTDASLELILQTLNSIGLEVEEVIDRSTELSDFKVAEIIEAEPHPNADKLKICQVKSSNGILQIVCGAPNARKGIKVILASVGSLIPNGAFQIKASEIRGVKSNGMLCSAAELLIGNDSNGIAELPSDAIIGENIAKYFGLDDPVIEISVTPNRGDCLGVYGVARDLAAAGLGSLRQTGIPQMTHEVIGKSERKNELLALCKITGLKNTESPDWLKSYLRNIGQEPISAIVDVTNYISYSFARPLHAYDEAKIKGDLKIAFAQNGEKFLALNDKEYTLSSEDLIIRDSSGPQALAGIIGGLNSGCSLDTESIILESAVFDPICVAKMGRRHNINSDARHRFERNVDAAFTLPGIKIAASLIMEICGGKASEISVTGEIDIEPRSIEFDPKTLEEKTGLKLPNTEIIKILSDLGFKVEEQAETLSIKIPSWRHDVAIKEDIVEEIIRIYGYDKIPMVSLPELHKARVLSQPQRRSFEAKRILASIGYDELVTWSFMDSEKAEAFAEFNSKLQLQNPISSQLNYMRPTIVPNLLEAISKNLARSINDLSFFEVGPVFHADYTENISIAGARTIKLNNKTPHEARKHLDIFDIKADLGLLMEELGLSLDKCTITANAPKYFHPTRSATITLGKNIIGYFGEIHPNILSLYDIKEPVITFEINLNMIPECKLKYGYKGKFNASIYQKVERDFAFVVDSSRAAGEMISYLQKIDKKLIKEVSLFDVYEGDKLEEGKKSLAFNVILQAEDHTLTDAELGEVSNNIIKNMSEKFGAELRR